jgi:hypothetical protein
MAVPYVTLNDAANRPATLTIAKFKPGAGPSD